MENIIKDRENTIHELKKINNRLCMFEDSSYEAIAIFDENYDCVDLNKAAEKLFGYPREEMIGESGMEWVGTEYQELANMKIRADETKPYVVRLLRKDGSSFNGIIQGETVIYNGCKFRVASCRDVSEIDLIQEKYTLKNNQFESIFNNSLAGIFILDKDGIAVNVNAACARILGYDSADELIGTDSREFFASKQSHDEFYFSNYDAFYKKQAARRETQLKRKDGSLVWTSLSGSTVSDKIPPDLEEGFVWMIEDISIQKDAEAKMTNAYNELEVIFNNALVGIIVLKGDRIVHRVNQTFADMIGNFTPEEWIGKSARELHLSQENFEEFGNKYYSKVINHEIKELDYQVLGSDGNPLWVTISGRVIDRDNPSNLEDGIVWAFRDITKRKQMEDELIRTNRIDSLTNVYNRRYFYEKCNYELDVKDRYEIKLSLLMLDIDYFKRINDTRGHHIGDLALTLFAEVCKKTVRSVDIIGRVGGEEFAILLLETDLKRAKSVAGRIQEELSLATENHESIPPMTVSVGAVELFEDEPLEFALNRADELMYLAKKNGRNRVEA